MNNKMDMKSAFIKVVYDAYIKFENSALVLGDIGHFGFKRIWDDPKLANRYFNLGILEQSMIGFCAGLSRAGMYPIIHTITPFLVERPFEQIKVDFGLNGLSGCFISVGGAYDYSTLGPTHHSYADLALFSTINNSHVFSVSSHIELYEALNESVSCSKLSYIRMNRNVVDISSELHSKSYVYHLSEGSSCTIVSTGGRTNDVLSVISSKSFSSNFSFDVFHVSRLKPFAADKIIDSLQKTRKLLVVEDHSIVGSLYSTILLNTPPQVLLHHTGLNLSDSRSYSYGSYDNLASKFLVSSESIASSIASLVS